jgi:hypothetical protein
LRRWLVWLGWLLAGLFAAAALFVGVVLQPYSLFIIQNTNEAVLKLDVVVSGRTVWKGSLPAGHRRLRLSKVDRDTGIALTCASRGQPTVATERGYVTTGRVSVTTITVPDCANPHHEVNVLP